MKDRPIPALHPSMADLYREKVTKLCAGLEEEAGREAAIEAIRGLV